MAPRPIALSRASERPFYHATTASARAAELAAASHRRQMPFSNPAALRAQRASNRQQMAQLPLKSADKPPKSSSSSSSSHKRVRVVLEKRLIRGSAVFRAPTEQDIDEYLRLESSRQMLTCASATVDLPPMQSAASLCASCARAFNPALPPPPPRLASLLAKSVPEKTPLDLSSVHAPLDMTQLAMLDEYTAVAMFLRRLRAQRSSMLFSVRARHVYPADKLSTITVRKPQPSQPRSLSADNPTLMLPSSPRILISTPTAAVRDTYSSATCVPPLLFENPRARSELLPSPPSVSDAPSATPTSRHAPSTLTNFSVPHMRSSSKSPQSPLESRRRHTRHGDEHDDDDTTTTAVPLRILTAIEPVDPAGALEHAQLCRGASYHVSATGLDLPLFRRRRRTSGADHGDNGFLNKLHRLRSFRRRPDSWASIVRRFSTQRDVNAR